MERFSVPMFWTTKQAQDNADMPKMIDAVQALRGRWRSAAAAPLLAGTTLWFERKLLTTTRCG